MGVLVGLAAGGHWKSGTKALSCQMLGIKPPADGDKGVWGQSPQRWVIFCNFSIKITHFCAYFYQYFTAINHQLKAF